MHDSKNFKPSTEGQIVAWTLFILAVLLVVREMPSVIASEDKVVAVIKAEELYRAHIKACTAQAWEVAKEHNADFVVVRVAAATLLVVVDVQVKLFFLILQLLALAYKACAWGFATTVIQAVAGAQTMWG